MPNKPVALPRPPRVESVVTSGDGIDSPQAHLDGLIRRRDSLTFEQELLDAEIERFAIESICGPTDDTQDVEAYDGTLGVTRQFVDDHERPIGQLQWLDDLPTRFRGPAESPGNVSGARWGSGGLFANDLYITAGHCFDQFGGGWQRPRRNGVTISSQEIATLMRINFNFQVNGQSGQTRAGDPFPIEELLEFRLGGFDFAIVRVGKNAAGKHPGEIYGTLKLAASDLTTAKTMLCMIQHPSGRPKKIEAGPMHSNVGSRIDYDSLDTEGGSSGSPILSPGGEVVGVHTNGGCSRFSGANFGVNIGAVRSASGIIT